jgi:hypothetical protein
MTTYLSHLSILGFGTYLDFWPGPIARLGEYVEEDYETLDFAVDDYTEETTLTEGAETKLLSPLVFQRARGDEAERSLGVRRISAELSNININKIPAPRQLLGVTATGTLYEVESGEPVERLTGMITEVNCAPERMHLTIEQDATAPLQALVPKRLVKDFFPSANFDNLGVTADPCVIIPWGTMYKVPLPMVQRPYVHCEFDMDASANSFMYVDITSVPDYVVQAGDVLQYDVLWSLLDTFVAMDVAATDGTTLRASGTLDTNGLSCHPSTDLSQLAVGRWYRREIPLTVLVGKTLGFYMVACEGEAAGLHLGHIANAQIMSAQGDLRLAIINELVDVTTSVIANTPGTNTADIHRVDWWVHGPFRTPQAGELLFHSVYRGTALIDPSEYQIFQPVPNLTCILFESPQRDTTGAQAVISATVTSTEWNHNPALIKQFLLSNALDGCNVPVDAAAFGTAAAVLDTARILATGGLATQRPAIDVIGDLTFYGEQLSVNDAGQYTEVADSAALHTLQAIQMGEGEGEWENVSFAPATYRLLDQLKEYTIKADLVQDFGGSETYAVSAVRSQIVNGSVVTDEEPYLHPKSVDREVYYRFTRNKHASLYRAEVSAKSMELRSIDVNDVVKIHCPNDPDMDGRDMLVTARTLSAEEIAFSLRGYDAEMYTYVGVPIQTTGIPPLVDYRFTLPATPTNFAVVNAVPTLTSDGSVKTFVTLTADAPEQNVTDLRFRGIPVGSVLFTEVPVAVTRGQTNVQAVLALEPGLSYHYECYAYNGANDPDYRYGVPAQLLNQLTPGDITVPDPASAIQVRQSGTKTVEIEATFTPPDDWGTTHLYRSTVDNTSSAVIIESGKKKIFHDQNIVYDTTYYYWVKVADNSRNASSFSPSSGHSILISRLSTPDYSDNSISTTKIQNLAITNAKINDLSASKINTGLLRVDQTGTGASKIFVDAPSLIEMESMSSTPARISFVDASNIERGSIAGTVGGGLTVDADANITLDSGGVLVGAVTISVGTSSTNNLGLTVGAAGLLQLNGKLHISTIELTEAPVTPGTSPNARVPIYNTSGVLVAYLWASV